MTPLDPTITFTFKSAAQAEMWRIFNESWPTRGWRCLDFLSNLFLQFFRGALSFVTVGALVMIAHCECKVCVRAMKLVATPEVNGWASML